MSAKQVWQQRQRIVPAVIPERRSPIRDRNTLERLPFAIPARANAKLVRDGAADIIVAFNRLVKKHEILASSFDKLRMRLRQAHPSTGSG
jgi:hypothetical protein